MKKKKSYLLTTENDYILRVKLQVQQGPQTLLQEWNRKATL